MRKKFDRWGKTPSTVELDSQVQPTYIRAHPAGKRYCRLTFPGGEIVQISHTAEEMQRFYSKGRGAPSSKAIRDAEARAEAAEASALEAIARAEAAEAALELLESREPEPTVEPAGGTPPEGSTAGPDSEGAGAGYEKF